VPSPGGAPEGHDGRGGETTHISVVDASGNAVALTVTNSSAFGAGVAVAGFFLNDSGVQSIPAGSGGAAWRTRTSTIAPTMLFEGDRLQVIVGSPGGGRIPLAMAQVISYVADYRMDPLDAVRMPRLYTTGAASKRVELEHGFAPEVLEGIRAMGYVPVEPGFGYARLYLIARRGDGWVGAADPRHDGRVRGY
jgi:gamma-glutamyltranspeptidase/glutathione hydrolase